MSERKGSNRSRVLVTGGAGFIGSNFVHFYLERFPDSHLVVLDALTYAGRRENLDGIPARFLTFIHGDIRDPAGQGAVAGPGPGQAGFPGGGGQRQVVRRRHRDLHR